MVLESRPYEGMNPHERALIDAGFPGQQSWLSPNFANYSNPVGKLFQKNFLPHVFVDQQLQHEDTQRYANVGDVARSIGVDTARRGEAGNIESARRGAAAGGLGRGYADQMESDIRQQGTQGAADALLGAELEERSRRAQIQALYADALIQTNKAAYGSYLAKKAAKAGKSSGLLSAIGSVGGALLGGPIGGAIGGLVGGAVEGGANPPGGGNAPGQPPGAAHGF
jgi:hypothetical protein